MPNPVPFFPAFETHFPLDDYTPYGYLHTPTHTGLNPSGVLRSVPALGFGLYTRGLPWYGMENMRAVNNYICIARPALRFGDVLLCEREDFDRAGIALGSTYHSGNVFSYDFLYAGARFSLAWYRIDEDAFAVRVWARNDSDTEKLANLSCALHYGMNARRWWGSDATTIRYVPEARALVAKILAYGDVFAMVSSTPPAQGVTAANEEELRAWQEGKIELSGEYQFHYLPDPSSGALLVDLRIPAGGEISHTIVIARGVSERAALRHAKAALAGAERRLIERLEADDRFYAMAPVLRGDWPDSWRHSWIYDFETLRMNLLDPRGIYKHVWDGMQPLNPRVVLGETAIDMLTLGYADLAGALSVMEGIFADAPEACVPCTREDGSMNMIGEDGSECPTAPIWGMPLRAIRILLARSGDMGWLRRLYPYLQDYIEWWRTNRTDSEGWFHCNNSWESGQDGSSRFVTDEDGKVGPKEAANVDHVRTADLEAAMTAAFKDMAAFAQLLGFDEDRAYYQELYEEGLGRTHAMFVDKCFRDFDARTGKPFLPEDKYDMMLTMPVALGLSTPGQRERMRWLFELYDRIITRYAQGDASPMDMQYGPVWPPILQTVVEAAQQMGDAGLAARMVANMLGPAYARNDMRMHQPMKPPSGIPEKYAMYIPGNGRENLNMDLAASSCENYGWGSLGPALILENILGLRPLDPLGRAFTLTPSLPDALVGGVFEIQNLSHGPFRFDVAMARDGDAVEVSVTLKAAPQGGAKLLRADEIIAQGMSLRARIAPGECLTVCG